MSTFLHTTFGSQKVLQQIRAEHPDQVIMMVSDDQDQSNFQLLEQTHDEQAPFSSPVSYQVLDQQKQTDEIRGWVHFAFFTLPESERGTFVKQWSQYQDDAFVGTPGLVNSELLQRTDDWNQLAILTTWTMREYYTIWQADNQSPLQRYEDYGNRYGNRNSSYSPVALTKQL
ncbi:heme-degrading monooxygenase HmoA [Weissella uvarum]|uniref:hypothetical protein n=1 Tax=Weissella uvarum TaxID=1479233 RepID=UPI001960CD0E|nr:hypothetical protein [Weissella uvarum]MBM7617739.1 heme-degrading monooxygenase HmoA [Weissella uvarum]MCM0595882.1 hypothetical protein [Weissella uvarum]